MFKTLATVLDRLHFQNITATSYNSSYKVMYHIQKTPVSRLKLSASYVYRISEAVGDFVKQKTTVLDVQLTTTLLDQTSNDTVQYCIYFGLYFVSISCVSFG